MISAVVLTKNEEKNIVDCLESLSFCDEILVIDDNSEDRTIELAKRLNAKVYVNSLENDFSSQRNFALKKARGDWIFFVDADERVSLELAKEIRKSIYNHKNTGYLIKREDIILGKRLTHGELSHVYLLRLAKKGYGKWIGRVHEKWDVIGKKDYLKNPLNHYSHQTIESFLREINFYTNLRAEELFKKGEKVTSHSIFLYPGGKFLLNFLIKLGFLDGLEGLIVAIMMSFHSFLVRAKLWALIAKK